MLAGAPSIMEFIFQRRTETRIQKIMEIRIREVNSLIGKSSVSLARATANANANAD